MSAEAGDFRDGAGRERCDDLVDELAALLGSCVVHVAQLLVVLPGEGDFVVWVAEGEFGVEPGYLFVAGVFGATLQDRRMP